MQACDRYAVEKLGISGLVLMENAGRGVVDAIEERFGRVIGRTFTVVCGKGNNGGDGFVVARHLLLRGAHVRVLVAGNPGSLTGDARANFDAFRRISGALGDKETVLRVYKKKGRSSVLPQSEFIVDALFGTGFSGAVRPPYADIIASMNRSRAARISIDISSGVSADNGEAWGPAVRADLTVTMALRKIGLFVGAGRTYAGDVKVADIGAPLGEVSLRQASTYLPGPCDIREVLPHRSPSAHKHSVGKIFMLAGSRGLTGAAAMAAGSAMRAGAGAVILGTPEQVYPILARKLTEVMVEPLPGTQAGSLGLEALSAIQRHLAWADIVVLGPGLSRHPETQELVQRIVSSCDKPTVIDADGLNALSENPRILRRHRSKDIILTPHTGELSRLTQVPSAEIERNRVGIARDFARKFALTVVLKGSPTVTACEDGKAYVNPTGNPGMATAGTGDVLTGAIAGLWGQGMDRTAAAFCGVYLHGRAGDIARGRLGEKSLLAADLLELLPQAILEAEAGRGS